MCSAFAFPLKCWVALPFWVFMAVSHAVDYYWKSPRAYMVKTPERQWECHGRIPGKSP